MRSLAIDRELVTFDPAGYITAANISDLQEQITAAVNSPKYVSFLIDMTKVEFLDSAGLMVLVSAFRLAQSLGKELSICSISPSVKIIFELTQLDTVLTIFENRESFQRSMDEQIAA